jgi:hypothetical protein
MLEAPEQVADTVEAHVPAEVPARRLGDSAAKCRAGSPTLANHGLPAVRSQGPSKLAGHAPLLGFVPE